MLGPREVPSRHDFYMAEAFLNAWKSKDPNTQVGARIVSADNEPMGTGYNGPPRTTRDNEIDWSRGDKDSPCPLKRAGKYPFIIHAEDNAIKHSKKKRLRGATIYVTAPPCRHCMLDIAEAEIHTVVFFRPKGDPRSMTQNDEEWAVTQDVARRNGVQLVEYRGDLSWLWVWMDKMKALGVFDRRVSDVAEGK